MSVIIMSNATIELLKASHSLQFFNLRQSVGLLGRGSSLSQGRYLTQTQNK
jgi:hypothetical protein